MQFLTYTVYSIPLSALYLLGIMPAIHSFEMLALSMLPTAFVIGVFIARPASAGKAMAVLFGFVGTMALHDTNTADLVSFIDTQVAQIMGVGLAAVIAAIFRTVSADWARAASGRQLARPGGAGGLAAHQARHGYAARMLDRIGLLQPRLALAKRPDDVMAADALKDLRVGRDITELQRARRHGRTGAAPVLDGLARYFRDRSSWRGGQKTPEFLAQIDRALAGVAGAPAGPAARDRAVVALVGIRRAFFPDAPVPTRPSPPGGPRIMIGEFNLYGIYFPWLLVLGVVTLGVAWALRRLLAPSRPVPAGVAPGAVRPRAVRGAALRRHPDISLYFPETRMKIPNALRPAAIGKFALTAAVVAAAVATGWQLWVHYEIEPWTRDGRVKAYVVQVAPDVSGLVTDVPVHDNQDVKAGDVLFEIDRARFQLAYDQAQASVRSQQVAREQAARRQAQPRAGPAGRGGSPGTEPDQAAADRGRAGPGRGAVEQRAPEPGAQPRAGRHRRPRHQPGPARRRLCHRRPWRDGAGGFRLVLHRRLFRGNQAAPSTKATP